MIGKLFGSTWSFGIIIVLLFKFAVVRKSCNQEWNQAWFLRLSRIRQLYGVAINYSNDDFKEFEVIIAVDESRIYEKCTAVEFRDQSPLLLVA